MSEACIVNIKKHNLNFEELNNLANRLVNIALKNKVAVTFNDVYWENIIQAANMNTYFTISDTFLYRNTNTIGKETLFDLFHFVEELSHGNVYEKIRKDEAFRYVFKAKYHFLEDLIRCVFMYKVDEIEIYMTEDACGIVDIEDFDTKITNIDSFMHDLFESIEDEMKNEFNYTWSDTKFVISKQIDK